MAAGKCLLISMAPLQVYAVYIRLNMGGLYKVSTLPRSPRRQVITGGDAILCSNFYNSTFLYQLGIFFFHKNNIFTPSDLELNLELCVYTR